MSLIGASNGRLVLTYRADTGQMVCKATALPLGEPLEDDSLRQLIQQVFSVDGDKVVPGPQDHQLTVELAAGLCFPLDAPARVLRDAGWYVEA